MKRLLVIFFAFALFYGNCFAEESLDLSITALKAPNGYSDNAKQTVACQDAAMQQKYTAAVTLMDNEQYEEAITAFEALNGYSDSAERLTACHDIVNDRDYALAKTLMDNYRYQEALIAFEELKGYSDSAEQVAICQAALVSIDRTISVEESNIYIYRKKEYKLNPTITLLNENAATKTEFKYSSSDIKIAKVAKDGTITAISYGDASITCCAADNPYIGVRISVHIVPSISKITLSENKMVLNLSSINAEAGKSILTVTISPENAYNQSLTWTSNKESVATVDEKGCVRSIGVGKAIITATATDGSKTKATCAVTVMQAVESITIEAPDSDIQVGKATTLNATILPQNAGDKKLTWTSSDESVATISSSGKIKGIGAGSVTITATSSSGINAELQTTVIFPPVTLKITASSKCIAKNHVGNNWSTDYSVNEKEYSKVASIDVQIGQIISIGYYITESDKNPECNGFTQDIEITEDIMKNGFVIDQTVYVYENGGRYSGNGAEWKITIKAVP